MAEVALITGAKRGLGAALYRVFHEHDFNCILNCRHADDCEFSDLASEHTYHICGDLCDQWIINRLGHIAREKGVKVLINNAGIYSSDRLVNMTEREFRHVQEVNLVAPVLLTRAVWPVLQETGGIVVNINSIAGLQGGNKELAYCASKHGLAGFSRALQFDATDDGVRVLNVYLGAMNTDMMKGRSKEPEKLIDPNEAAKVIYDLCRNYDTLRITEATILRRQYS